MYINLTKSKIVSSVLILFFQIFSNMMGMRSKVFVPFFNCPSIPQLFFPISV